MLYDSISLISNYFTLVTNSQCSVLKFFLGFYGPTTTPSNTTDNSTETTTLTPNATTRSPNWKYELGLYFKLYQIYICNWSNMITFIPHRLKSNNSTEKNFQQHSLTLTNSGARWARAARILMPCHRTRYQE